MSVRILLKYSSKYSFEVYKWDFLANQLFYLFNYYVTKSSAFTYCHKSHQRYKVTYVATNYAILHVILDSQIGKFCPGNE